jgi:DNA-binding CsgD family transcriptional regulator
MNLIGRETRPTDLDQCLEMVRDRFLYDRAELAALRDMWQSVLDRDVGRSTVLFDSGDPERVLAFGISAAIKDAHLATLEANRAPFVGRALFDAWRSGDDPFLDEASFATANARDGLNVIVMHNGVDDAIVRHHLHDALSLLTETFVAQHRGSNMKIVLHEAFGVPAQFALDLGLFITPYAEQYDTRLASVPADRMPIVVSMTRAEAERRPGNLVFAQIFLRFSPPVCDLQTADRRLLRLALAGTPDEAIAEFLQIAPRTLKKRWSDVYARMEHVTRLAPGGDGGHRGAEIRRHVLRYVREHPEELHAYDPSFRRATARV